MTEPDTKSMKQLVAEGTIPKAQLKSLLLLAQVGMFFSCSPEDAKYIQEQIVKLNNGEEIGT